MRLDRRILLAIGIGAGLALGRIGWSAPLALIVLLVAVAYGTWVARGLLEGSNGKESTVSHLRRTRVETYWPPRCSHCGARASSTLRMIAGRDAYICELCLRRWIELLDAPDDITRFR